ncbi:serine hydrolase, partial [Acinetobacter baumannii]
DSAYALQDHVYNQPNAADGRPTIENYIKQIFLVSDNDAFNRLYEFLGQDYIQQKLKEKGYPDAVIRHRLQLSRTPDHNANTNPV